MPPSSDWEVRALTSGPNHHFFGYYGMSPWNASGTKLLCLQSSFQNRKAKPNEAATICVVDPETGETTPVGKSYSWNHQQGCMMHWDPRQPESRILFNDRKKKKTIGVALDIETGERREYPRAISAVSHDGQYALSLTYGRLQRLRKVVGYSGTKDPNPRNPAPDNDGVFLMNLETGEVKLAVSIADVYEVLLKEYPYLKGSHLWFNHTVFNKDDSRFFFLARARIKGHGRKTAMFTVNTDGTDLWEAITFEADCSHFDWRNNTEIIATYPIHNPERDHVLLKDQSDAKRRILAPDFLMRDGHCTFGSDGNWLLTDPRTKDRKSRQLLIYNVETDERVHVGTFNLGKYYTGDQRCDLHPRWKNTGDAICFDAIDKDGTRQMFIARRVKQ